VKVCYVTDYEVNASYPEVKFLELFMRLMVACCQIVGQRVVFHRKKRRQFEEFQLLKLSESELKLTIELSKLETREHKI